MKVQVLLVCATLVVCAHSETKIWVPDTVVDDWHAHSIKCPKTALKFDDESMEFFEGYSHEKEIIFAVTGFYIFQDNTQMVIGDSPDLQTKECEHSEGEQVTVHSPKPLAWANPKNWHSETNYNPAKPDIEKIPCGSDEIVFSSALTRVDLDGIYELQFQRLKLLNKWLSPRDFGSFCKTAPGQKMFANCELTNIEETRGDSLNQACQSNTAYYEQLVCANVQCPAAKCLDPIRPFGFCCDTCGASFEVVYRPNSSMELSGVLSKKLANLDSLGKLAIYSSYFNDYSNLRFQVNIMEREEYSGESVKAMDKVLNNILKRMFSPDEYVVIRSGLPYDPTSHSHIFAQIFLPLAFICTIFFVSYKMSYDPDFNVNWRTLVQRLTGRSQFIFAQFENVMEDHDGRITISRTRPSTPNLPGSVEKGVDCLDSGMELVAGGPKDKNFVLPKDQLDEIVETISSTTESVSLISVDME